ncbi:MAG: VacJ family lipoprotein [Arenibacterium sp.]
MTRCFQPARVLLVAVLLGLVSACTVSDRGQREPGGVFDPYERTNRGIHAFNRAADRALLRPASRGYVTIFPAPVVTSFSHFSDNLNEPGNVLNSILQGDAEQAGTALVRFLINTTIGFLGLADPATEFGISEDETDFGETLYVWGVGEGAYIELPFLGASTQRDSIGIVVDLFTNPISYARNNPFDNIGVYAEIVQRLGDRGQFSDTVDSILYESEDSYAQLRVIYLQNRRFELGSPAGDDSFADPYDDVYGDSSFDPYEDPYAE